MNEDRSSQQRNCGKKRMRSVSETYGTISKCLTDTSLGSQKKLLGQKKFEDKMAPQNLQIW